MTTRNIDLSFVSRSDAIDAGRIGSFITYSAPVAGMAPLAGRGNTFERRAGAKREVIVYPPEYRLTVLIKRLHENATGALAAFDLAAATEFMESTCLYGEQISANANAFAGVRGVITAYQSSPNFAFKPSANSPRYVEIAFTLDVVTFART